LQANKQTSYAWLQLHVPAAVLPSKANNCANWHAASSWHGRAAGAGILRKCCKGRALTSAAACASAALTKVFHPLVFVVIYHILMVDTTHRTCRTAQLQADHETRELDAGGAAVGSCRTDKGVHSLCTVIGLRILMDDTTYHEDPEGICYARAINQHLPADVRVFCVQVSLAVPAACLKFVCFFVDYDRTFDRSAPQGSINFRLCCMWWLFTYKG
jgi:hypothetical protein